MKTRDHQAPEQVEVLDSATESPPATRRKQMLRDVVQGINSSKEDENQREKVQGKEECEKPINNPKEG
jgi:hypothetical protein